jgi:hypothetical protein
VQSILPMISIQLADAFQSIFGQPDEPTEELTKRYEQATRSIANSFTLQLTEDDERYLYSRYKKIKNDASKLLRFVNCKFQYFQVIPNFSNVRNWFICFMFICTGTQRLNWCNNTSIRSNNWV